MVQLTGSQLHPGADLVDASRVAEEKEAETNDAANDQQHGDPHEEHGCLESSGRYGAEVKRAPFAGELRGERVADAVVEKAEVPGLRRVDTVPDPVGLDEHHHGDDSEGDGENCPHNTHGSSVTHVVGVVDFCCLLSREHVERWVSTVCSGINSGRSFSGKSEYLECRAAKQLREQARAYHSSLKSLLKRCSFKCD